MVSGDFLTGDFCLASLLANPSANMNHGAAGLLKIDKQALNQGTPDLALDRLHLNII